MNPETNPTETNKKPSRPVGLFSAPRQDFLSSVVVFLVALPLCMGIAIASGVPVAAGLFTGIVGGLVVGFLAGAPLQVSGPAAGLTVIVFELVQNHGLEVLGIAVFVGGTLQLIAGLLGYGRWFRAVSPAVIHGMLAGIGILILSSQFHVMVDDSPKGNGLTNLLSIPEAIQKGLPMPEMGSAEERSMRRDLLQQIGRLHEQQVQQRELVAELIPDQPEDPDADSVSSGLSLPDLDQSQLDDLAQKQQELLNQLTSLVDQFDAQEVAQTVRNPDRLKAASQQCRAQSQLAIDALRQGKAEGIRESQADIQHSLEDVLGELKNHDWAAKVGLLTILTLILWKALVPAKLKLIPAPLVAVIVATVATAILKLPVLYVEVPDNLWSEIHLPSWTVLQTTPLSVILKAGIVLAVVASAETLLCATAVDQMQSTYRTNYNRELFAQGVGNMICGFVGALPMTGVIVRSSANIEAGGKTRLSAILHGLWLLVFVSLLAFVLRMIPTAALAAMLVYIGYKLVNFQSIRNLKKHGWGEVFIYAATVGTIVCTDLLTGVLTGIGLSAAKLLYSFSNLVTDVEIDEANRKAELKLEGAATFIGLPILAEALEKIPGNVNLHVNFERLDYIDHACLDLLINWDKQHEATGGTLIIDWDTLHAQFRSKNSKNNNQKRFATRNAG
ncbi:MAG: SulP family inorganic anion transporter [Pirellulales bacterium]|nr:SulP family inorganic anion transporter [Pirellulales bacterium]